MQISGADRQGKQHVFLELFSGKGMLSACMRREGASVCAPLDVGSCTGSEFDILNPAHWRHLKQLARMGGITWLHCAPPCKTCSRARRTDIFGTAPILRSDDHPDGVPGLTSKLQTRVDEANDIYDRMVKVIRIVARSGGWWSVENPANSYLWATRSVVKLFKLPEAAFYIGDQCMFGGQWRKPTGWLTTCEALSFLQVRCPGGVSHQHERLAGRVTLPSGEEVWKTELAAAYPEDLCVSIARAVVARAAPSLSISTEVGQPHQGAEPIKKHTRQLAADASIGGLRDAAASLHHVPGWGPLGAQLRGFIDGAIADLDVDSILTTLGQEDTPEVLLLAGLHVRHLLAAWMFPGGPPPLSAGGGVAGHLVRRTGPQEWRSRSVRATLVGAWCAPWHPQLHSQLWDLSAR